MGALYRKYAAMVWISRIGGTSFLGCCFVSEDAPDLRLGRMVAVIYKKRMYVQVLFAF